MNPVKWMQGIKPVTDPGVSKMALDAYAGVMTLVASHPPMVAHGYAKTKFPGWTDEKRNAHALKMVARFCQKIGITMEEHARYKELMSEENRERGMRRDIALRIIVSERYIK